MTTSDARPDTYTTRAQGDLRLLDSEVARRLLASTIPARLAYVAGDGTPRIMSTWFHWTGDEVVMPTFIAAPHIVRPAARIRALRADPAVAITIDTDDPAPDVLLLRGRVTITEVDGVPAEFVASARRYQGDEAAAEYLRMIDVPGTRMARVALRPDWVGVLDFESRFPQPIGG